MILLIKRSSAVSPWICLNFVIKNFCFSAFNLSMSLKYVCFLEAGLFVFCRDQYFYEFILRWIVGSTRRQRKLLIKQIKLERPLVVLLSERLIENFCDFFFVFSLLIFVAADELFFWRWITVCWWISHFPYLFLINQKNLLVV